MEFPGSLACEFHCFPLQYRKLWRIPILRICTL